MTRFPHSKLCSGKAFRYITQIAPRPLPSPKPTKPNLQPPPPRSKVRPAPLPVWVVKLPRLSRHSRRKHNWRIKHMQPPAVRMCSLSRAHTLEYKKELMTSRGWTLLSHQHVNASKHAACCHTRRERQRKNCRRKEIPHCSSECHSALLDSRPGLSFWRRNKRHTAQL